MRAKEVRYQGAGVGDVTVVAAHGEFTLRVAYAFVGAVRVITQPVPAQVRVQRALIHVLITERALVPCARTVAPEPVHNVLQQNYSSYFRLIG